MPLPRALRARALVAMRRSSTSAIDRRSASTTGTSDTRLTIRGARLSPRSFSLQPIRCARPPPFTEANTLSGAERSWVRGRVSRAVFRRARRRLPPRCDRGGSFAPTRSRSSTSCRIIRARHGWSRRRPPTGHAREIGERIRRSAPALRFRDSPGPQAALARAPEDPGPPPAPLREKEMRSAAPEVLSAPRPLFRGGHYPQLVPNLWMNGPRLFNLRA